LWPLGGGKTEEAESRSIEESGLISRTFRGPASPLVLLTILCSSWKSDHLLKVPDFEI